MDTEQQELSLHYTLTQGDIEDDEVKSEHSPEPQEDEYFDPFAIEDNNKKFGNIEIEEKLPQTLVIDDKSDDNNDANEEEQKQNEDENVDVVMQNDELTETTDSEKKDSVDLKEDDEDINDDESDEEDDEDDDLRKEMEANWKKEESEKNKGMLDIINLIKSKAANKENEKLISPKLKKIGIDIPKLKPFAFDGNLKITFPSKTVDCTDKDDKIQKHRFQHDADNFAKKRRKMKKLLQSRLSKKRKKEMKKHQKEFGKEEDYFSDDDDDEMQQNVNNEREQESEDEHEKESEDEKIEKIKVDNEESESDVEEMEASKYIEDIVENGDDLDEEDFARAALMAKRPVIPDEVRELMAIAADEEDENGQINVNVEDEEEEKIGIAKNLLAEKSELKLLKQHQEIYDAKRNEVHRQMEYDEDDKALELMKKAFIDGDYRKLQTKHKNKYDGIMGGGGSESRDAENELKFRSRNFELDARNEPEYYLSDNEEKNEFCCYDSNGLFLNVHQIRMNINEWNRKHSTLNMQEDDEEDPETVKRRKKRVQRKEVIQSYNTMDGINHSNKINTKDKSAIKILEKLRNKKRKRPKLTKSQTFDGRTNFGSFYMEKGLKIAPLQQRAQSSSFLSHREKCIEKMKIAQNKSESQTGLTTSAGPGNSNQNRFLFQRLPTSKKRKRENSCYNNDNHNLSKKRKLQ